MKDVTQGMLATAAGAFIGSVIAAKIGLAWWLGGLIIGMPAAGISAYILFDLKEFLMSIPRAWSAAVGWRLSEKTVLKFKAARFAFFASLIAVPTFFAFCFGLLILGTRDTTGQADYQRMAYVFFTGYSLFFIIIIPCLIASVTECNRDLEENRKSCMGLIKYINPFSILYLLPFGSYLAMRWLIVTCPGVGKNTLFAAGRFFKFLFIFVHSKNRTMCLVDASLAVGGAYLLGAGPAFSVAAAVFGALLWFFNREFVAKKWLGIALDQV
ncbi:MAG: hypothetical protein V1668_04790 [Patescibacteria group bacterium]